MPRYVNPRPQFFDDDGNPLALGKIYIYESGTSTLKNLFSDVNLSKARANPVVLTGAGRLPNVFYTGSSRQILENAAGTQTWDIDPVGGDVTEGNFTNWNSLTIYNKPDIVIGSDNNFYRSITNANQGNDPTTSATNWEQVKLYGVWNTNVTYAQGDIAQGSDDLLYVSQTNSNQGNNPTTDTTNWGPASASANDLAPVLTFFTGG